jgi:2-(1,2-epoxy-1,2-dihydrophenyl)acetyl-CoA isomerase
MESDMTIASNEFLTVQRDGAIVEITLNRPERYNAFGKAIRDSLAATLTQLGFDKEVRVVILTGAGKAFCSGADLREEFYPDLENDILNSYMQAINALRSLNKIVIAAINGVVAGIGAALLTSSDLAVMSEEARLDLAFARIGLVPDGGLSWDLVHALGYKRAMRLIMEGGSLTAKQCLDAGIVNEIVPAADVLSYARDWAKRITEQSPSANRGIKRVLHFALDASRKQTVEYEAIQQQRLIVSHDCIEGVTAFKEKRKPVFTGE